MSNTKVQITFSAPLIFLSSDHWAQLRAAIVAQFPLCDVIWKSSLRPATRTIQELDVELIGFDTLRDEHASQVPQTLLEKPLLNLYIVTCDDTDTYKGTVRRQIKDWHSNVSQRRNQEWMILLVVRPDARASAGGFFAIKSSVLDRIKSDFNSDKRDRCVQIVWSQGAITAPACADMIAKMKEGIMAAFESAVIQRSEEVRRSESQRQMPGWNFCTFFILKESLASSFVGMSLTDDAILTYSELEVSVLQAQTPSLSGQRNVSWFGKVINPDADDDSIPLLDIGKKPYRDLILSNTISVFDLRVYLLAKHCEVLGMSGRVSEMARKAASFLGGFGQRLKECDAPLPLYFVESWIFSAALHVVSECDKWAMLFELDTATQASFNAVKGELLELARIQLDKVGIAVGHLPESIPFSMSLPASAAASPTASSPSSPQEPPNIGQITNKELLVGLADRDAFDKLYVDTTNRAIDMYVKGGRRKFALKLHGSLAALDVYRSRHDQAHGTYSSLPAHYTPQNWTFIATFMQCRGVDAHARLSKPHDREWMEMVLALLQGFIEQGTDDAMQLLGPCDVQEYVSRLVEQVRDHAGELAGDIVFVDHPMLSMEIESDTARHAMDRDGSFVDVLVHNALPCNVVVDDIRLLFSGRDSEQLDFWAPSQVLSPGTCTVTVFSSSPAMGLFVLDFVEVSISAIKLRWNHQKHVTARQRPSLIRIPKDNGAVDVQIESPRRVQLDSPQNVMLTLRSGRNKISRAVLKFSSQPDIPFKTKSAEFIQSDVASVECTENGVVVTDMEKEGQIQIRVPHSYHASAEPLKVIVEMEYHTSEADSITRVARFARQVTTSLPLMIQAHDHFRGKSLFSKFTVSTSPGTYQHLRISSVKLECIEDEQGGLVIQGCQSPKRRIVPVTPNQPANFLFRVDSEVPRTAYASMHLCITYCLLREEIEGVVRTHVSSTLEALSLPLQISADVTGLILKALEKDGSWLDRYNATHELYVTNNLIGELPDSWDVERIEQAKNAMDAIIESLRRNQLDNREEVWREVVVPVDLPFKNIVSSAQIRIHPNKSSEQRTDGSRKLSPVYAGQPIPATLTISNSFHWSGPGSLPISEKSYSMRFEVREMAKDWLISGRKKGEFLATDGSVHSVPLTLIPLHHGEINLPQVGIHPLPLTSGEMTMGSMALPSAEAYQGHGAECVLVLPRGGRTTFVVDMEGEG